jgi:3',5'-cyclic AMP phosphodiesterase CpdA
MKIALTSDLHVDHHPVVATLVADCLRERFGPQGPDVLVVAGDVSASPAHVEEALRTIRPATRRAVYVPGNHDLWTTTLASSAEAGAASPPSSRARYESILPTVARAAGFDPLGAAPVIIDGVVFVGVTGWYDFSLRNRDLDATFTIEDYRRSAWGRLRWNDNVRVVWPDDEGRPLEAAEICAAQVRSLEAQLAAAAGRPTVVVTHHLPFAELVTSTGQLPWDFLNGFMGSAALGAAILRTPGVRLALAGHTHFRKSAVLPGVGGPVRAETSPIGYPREYGRAGLDLAARVRDRVTAFEL